MPKIVCRVSNLCIHLCTCMHCATNGCEKINWKTKSSDILTAKD